MFFKKWLFTLDCPFSSTVISRRRKNVFLILPPYDIFSSYCSLLCHWCVRCSLSVDVMTLAREFANLSNSEMVNSLWGHLLFLAFSTNHNLLICFHWHYVTLKSRDTQIGWKYIGTAVWTSRRNFSMTSHDYVLFNQILVIQTLLNRNSNYNNDFWILISNVSEKLGWSAKQSQIQ